MHARVLHAVGGWFALALYQLNSFDEWTAKLEERMGHRSQLGQVVTDASVEGRQKQHRYVHCVSRWPGCSAALPLNPPKPCQRCLLGYWTRGLPGQGQGQSRESKVVLETGVMCL